MSYGRRVLQVAGPFLGLIAVVALFGAIAPAGFLSAYNFKTVCAQTVIVGLGAIGMTFVIVSGGIDLSVGSVITLASVVTALLVQDGQHWSVAMLGGVVTGGACGAINGLLITTLRIVPFIATLGTMVLFRGATLLFTGGQPIVGEDGLPQLFVDFAIERLFGVPYLVWFPIILVLVFSWVLHRTAYGVRIFATGGNTEAAYLAGIAVDRVRISAYVWCGALAGVAGVMLASRVQSGQPTAGMFYELTAIAAVILGGASLFGGEGKLYKSVIGVFIMVVLANALNLANVQSYWQQVAVGLVIIAAAAADQFRHR